jgi:arginyl-tRNA synthetase
VELHHFFFQKKNLSLTELFFIKLEGGEAKYRAAWKKICEISRSEFNLVYERLNVYLEEKVLVSLTYFCYSNDAVFFTN